MSEFFDIRGQHTGQSPLSCYGNGHNSLDGLATVPMGSYEDLIVTQYLDKLNSAERKKSSASYGGSPYQQSVRLSATTGSKAKLSGARVRPSSARISSKKTQQNGRPSSARTAQDIPHRGHVQSASVSSSSCFSAVSHQQSWTDLNPHTRIPVHLRPPVTVSVYAHRNGSRHSPVKVTSRANLKQLLEECTVKLRLNSSARRIFLSDGTEVKDVSDLDRNRDVFVSCGQPFRDPSEAEKGKALMKSSVEWTMNGVQLPPDQTRGKTKSSLSRRMRSLIEKKKLRILVFRNGTRTEGVEVPQANPADFIDSCAQRLHLESNIRCFYDLECRKVLDPVDMDKDNFYNIDKCLQGDSLYQGPLWAVQGAEQFRVKGAYEYVTHLIGETKSVIAEKNNYISRLTHPLPGTPEAELTNSQAADQAEKALEMMKRMKTAVDELGELAEKLKKKCGLETADNVAMGSTRMQLLGPNGLRVKVHENGTTDDGVCVYFNLREAEKGTGNDQEMLRLKFLDECSSKRQLMASSGTLTSIATKMFNRDGEEISDVRQLDNEQDVWLSYGEAFKPLEVSVLELNLEPVSGIVQHNGSVLVTRKLQDISDMRITASDWNVTAGFPTSGAVSSSPVLSEDQDQVCTVDSEQTYLQQKLSPEVVVFPQLAAGVEPQKGSLSLQHWILDEAGCICSKAFPQLALTVLNDVTVITKSKRQGLAVNVRTRLKSSVHQTWCFNQDGSISSALDDGLVLTFLGSQPATAMNSLPSQTSGDTHDHSEENRINGEGFDDLRTVPRVDDEEVPAIHTHSQLQAGNNAFVAESQSQFQEAIQHRWALKQKTAYLIGQSRESKVVSPEWHARGLLWPSNKDGSWNEDLVWPVNALLLPHVPPIMWPQDAKTTLRRLQVLKNGEKSLRSAVEVLEPEIMAARRKTERQSRLPPTTKKWLQRRKEQRKEAPTTPTSEEAMVPEDVNIVQFHTFLDRCTLALSLPFAARRLFDKRGKELKALTCLENDQLLYVSCGEAWIDPNAPQKPQLSSEPQTSMLPSPRLATSITSFPLNSDRVLKELVLEVAGHLTPGDRLSVGQCRMNKKQRAALVRHYEEVQRQSREHDVVDIQAISPEDHAFHDIAHHRADEKRLNKLRSMRPWEIKDYQGMDGTGPVMSSSSHRAGDSSIDGGLTVPTTKKLPKSIPSQQWRYVEGYLQLRHNVDLVLGANRKTDESSGLTLDRNSRDDSIAVCLCHKEVGNLYQQWTLDPEGFVCCVADSKLILSLVSRMVIRPIRGSTTPELQSLLSNPFGTELVICENRATSNGPTQQWQRWRYDNRTGFIFLLTGDPVEDHSETSNTLSEKKSLQQSLSSVSTSGVYQQPTVYRIKAFLNGESETTAVTVTASDFPRLLDACTSRLKLTSAARRLYSLDGSSIETVDCLERDQLVAVSCGELYILAKEKKRQIEVKALWARSHCLFPSSVPPGTQR